MGEGIPELLKAPYSIAIEHGGVTYHAKISNPDSRTWNAAIELPDKSIVVTASSEKQVIDNAKDRLARIQ